MQYNYIFLPKCKRRQKNNGPAIHIVSKTVPVPALRHVIRVAAGSVPVPVEVVAGDVLVHAPAAVQVAVDVPVAAQEVAAVVRVLVPVSVTPPAQPKRRQN